MIGYKCMLAKTIAALFLSLCAIAAHAEEIVLPPNDGFITDPGDSIPLAEEEELERSMGEERKRTGVEFVAVILPTLAGRDIAHLAWELRTKWGIERNESGILLLIAREEGKALMAPGKSHDGVLTDAVLEEIITESVLPPLRRGNYAAAIADGADALHRRLRGENAGVDKHGGAVPIKGYSIIIAFLILLAFSAWMRSRRSRAGQPKRRHR